MRIDKVREHLQQHPEAAAPSNYLFGWDAIRQMFEPPPEIRAVLEMLRSAKRSDVIEALASATEFLGREPDALLLPILMDEFANTTEASIWFLVRGLTWHRRRLSTDPASWYRRHAADTYGVLRKSRGRRLIKALRSYGGCPYKRLRSEIPAALRAAEAQGYVGPDLPRAVEETIYRTTRPINITRKRAEDEHGVLRERFVRFDPVSAVLEDPTLHSYDGAEAANALLDQLVARAGLTSREREVLCLFRCGKKPKAIAQHLGVVPSTVYSLLSRIRAALKAAA